MLWQTPKPLFLMHWSWIY